MKSLFKNSWFFLLPAAALFFSCSDDSDDVSGDPQGPMTAEEVETAMEAEQASANIDGVVDYMLVANLDDTTAAKSADVSKGDGWLPDCYEITAQADGEGFTLSFDFGEGCEMPDGRMLAGKLTMTQINLENPDGFTGISEILFENFSVDDVTANGTKIYTHVMAAEAKTYTEVATDLELKWDDDSTVLITSNKKREWLNEVSATSWKDKVFLVTGNSTVVSRDGVTYTAEITTPLRVELSCHYYVSGVVSLTKDSLSGEVDFGDGSCDDKATFTDSEGTVVEIDL